MKSYNFGSRIFGVSWSVILLSGMFPGVNGCLRGEYPSPHVTPAVAAEDDVARRGREILERYVSFIHPDKGGLPAEIGASQAFALLFPHRSAREVKDTNEKFTAWLKPFVIEKYWITTREEDFRLYWSQTMLIKLLLDPETSSRLSAENQSLIKQLLWNFVEGFAAAYADYDFATSDPAHVSWILGSDNHDIIRRGFFLFGCQILKNDPEFAGRQLPGGGTPGDLYGRWVANLKLYFPNRAASGLTAEVASPGYIAAYLQPIFLMAEYAEDREVRSLATKFLDLTFADAAQETLNGLRGGARSRAYKNEIGYDGHADTLLMPIFLLTGQPASGTLDPMRPGNMPAREGFVIIDTHYRLPEVIQDLFRDRTAMGSFQFDSRRPAAGSNFTAWQREDPYPIYVPSQPSRYVRSTWVTPDYVLGWFTMDENQTSMLVHAQNQWMGVITSADNGRLAITGTPTSPDGRTSYDDLQAVGWHHSVIIRRNLRARGRGLLRVYFSPDFALAGRDGWLFAQSGDRRSWFALKAVELVGRTVSDVHLAPSDWGAKIPGGKVTGNFYVVPNEKAFLVIESGSIVTGSYEQFVQNVCQQARIKYSVSEAGITYRPTEGDESITLYQTAKTPEVGDRPVELPPGHVFWSPYLQSDDGRIFTIRAPSGKQFTINFSPGS